MSKRFPVGSKAIEEQQYDALNEPRNQMRTSAGKQGAIAAFDKFYKKDIAGADKAYDDDFSHSDSDDLETGAKHSYMAPRHEGNITTTPNSMQDTAA